MNFCDINPFIRFASYIHLDRCVEKPVMIKDCRIFYAISGKADIFIETEHYELVPGSLFYCCPGSIYDIQSDGAEIISLNFDLTQYRNNRTTPYPVIVIQGNQSLPTIVTDNVKDNAFVNSYLFVSLANDCEELLKKILDEFSTQKIYYQENSSALLKSILTHLHRHSIENSSSAIKAVSKTMAYIKANYDKPLNNEMLSNMTGYHGYHLNRLFTKHTGITVHKYILNVRINEAKNLLLNTDLSLASIAEKIGFNSNTHFSTYFKQVVGISPLEFRRRIKNKI